MMYRIEAKANGNAAGMQFNVTGMIRDHLQANGKKTPDVLIVTSYPPRECGIATYTHDLARVLERKFSRSLRVQICAVASDAEVHRYPPEVKYSLNADHPDTFTDLANAINNNSNIKIVLIQHEFGFFAKCETEFATFLKNILKPVIIVFHTVLPGPDNSLKTNVQQLASAAMDIIVMTKSSSEMLVRDYNIAADKITIIPHGTHLVPFVDKQFLKAKYNTTGRNILSTFGLLSSGKGIENTIDALPAIVEEHPDVLFLIIGKTHPSVAANEGERYRNLLEEKVATLQMQQHVRFVNYFVPLPDLLEYLQLTDIYLFTSRDPNQAVSGTFSYAISCGCPVISTPIPHVREVLQHGAGMIIDFDNPQQMGDAVIKLLDEDQFRMNIGIHGLHIGAATSWENSAIAHANLFERLFAYTTSLNYDIPEVNLDHIKRMTTGFGIIQFSKINIPDIASGYTLDDNARALIVFCQHYELTSEDTDLGYIRTYLAFIKYCLLPDCRFQNYVDATGSFTTQNEETNLEDAHGRAIWALGYLVSRTWLLPKELIKEATAIMRNALLKVHNIHSPRAMAFIIKGLCYADNESQKASDKLLIRLLADRLVLMYRHEADDDWRWFESYLTYANSILPEAMLFAWQTTGLPVYKEVASSSFDFLLSKTFCDNGMTVISNRTWLHKASDNVAATRGGEQPIDVAYTILALSKFYEVFQEKKYLDKSEQAFNWFLGANHLHHIIYNPCTGGCYDGLEEQCVNLNQGAESTISYLMARLTIEYSLHRNQLHKRVKEATLEMQR